MIAMDSVAASELLFAHQQAQQIGLACGLASARAVAGFQDAHSGQLFVAHIEHPQQHRAGRGHALHRLAGRVDRRIAQQSQRGRSGNGQRAVLADNGSAAHVERRRKPAIHAERLGARGGADNIDDGVHRAHLVEVHLFDGDGMDGGFRFAQQLKGANGALLHASVSGAARMISTIADNERCGAWVCARNVCVLMLMFGMRVADGVPMLMACSFCSLFPVPCSVFVCRLLGVITSTLVAARPPRLTLRISRRAPTPSAAAVLQGSRKKRPHPPSRPAAYRR
jgi:hypothetical protein